MLVKTPINIALSVRAVPFGARQAHLEISDSPKRSWFQNLFHFKPNAYTLWSYESVSITARVLQQQLSFLNVKVATETLADQMVLRCKFSRPEGMPTGFVSPLMNCPPD